MTDKTLIALAIVAVGAVLALRGDASPTTVLRPDQDSDSSTSTSSSSTSSTSTRTSGGFVDEVVDSIEQSREMGMTDEETIESVGSEIRGTVIGSGGEIDVSALSGLM